MEKTNKFTKKEIFGALKTHFENADININGITKDIVIDFIDHEVDLLSRKSARGVNIKKFNEDKAICDIIYNVIAEIGNPCTVADIMAKSDELRNYIKEDGTLLSTSKVTAMLTKMESDGRITSVKDKKKKFYSVA